MIEINLVPEQLKKKRRARIGKKGIKIPMEVVIGSAGGLLVLLFLVHIYLLGVNILKMNKLKSYEAKKQELAPAKENVDKILEEMKDLREKNKALQKVMGENKMLWAEKLNILSDNIPREVWLKKIAFNGESLLIDGSAVSRQNDEMIKAQTLLSSLKHDKEFLDNFKDLEVGSIQRRNVNNIGIADFIITVKVE